jgi:2-C-methyl-D-erythritol 4-phosphate cytidylyltransferase
VAAGSGERLRADRPKAFVAVAGRTLLEHAAARFDGCDDVVVVAPAELVAEAEALTGHRTVPGGATRQQSVAAGLAAISSEYVLVHDVARPFVPPDVIAAVVRALRDGADAVVPVVPIHDTVRRIEPDGRLGSVLDRSQLVAIQTPQGFPRSVLTEAHRHGAQMRVTDDAALVEALGGTVRSVPGADESFKITTPADLARAEALAWLLSGHPAPGGVA